ncbi:methyltransferase domain-containing protein [Halorubrum halophilum]|uniref:methyltransferase domain-containing protein n=1 Tax=Halorubrum halophilum TaxID=413816 RepID=UPI0009E18DA1|nr:methyltransferase domain-containing protein [Halorubrum halophilum]
MELHNTGKFLARKGINFVRQKIYSIGANYYCPLCESNIRKFMPAGSPPRIQCQCPVCGSRERHRLLWLYIKEKFDAFSSCTDILYTSPAWPLEGKLRENSNVNMITSDINLDVISNGLSDKSVDVYSDITSLSFRDDTFDLIICSHVLEHVQNDKRAIAEMSRVLKKDGYALVMVPQSDVLNKTHEDIGITTPKNRSQAFGAPNHVRQYGKDFYQRLSDNGFSVSTMTVPDWLNQTKIKRHGLRLHSPGHTSLESGQDWQYEKLYICIPSNKNYK